MRVSAVPLADRSNAQKQTYRRRHDGGHGRPRPPTSAIGAACPGTSRRFHAAGTPAVRRRSSCIATERCSAEPSTARAAPSPTAPVDGAIATPAGSPTRPGCAVIPERRSPSAGGCRWHIAAPQFPPPPASPPGTIGMSEAIERICDLRCAEFGFVHHRDEAGEIAAVQAVRVHAGLIETVLIHGEHEALAARCRDEPRPAVLWHRSGPTTDVITALLGLPATRSAPSLAGRTPSGFWIPYRVH